MTTETNRVDAGHTPAEVPDDVRDNGFRASASGPIDWFRAASPYIRAHRGATLVIAVPGARIASTDDAQGLRTLGHDLALLCHLGLRVVLCFGLRAQVDAMLDAVHSGSTSAPVIDGRRVTDERALQAILVAAGLARIELEARLSTGLPDTPNAGSELAVSSGNFVYARPFGVHDGVDFRHTGAVREVRAQAMNALLDAGHLVLQPPLGHSLTGEVFNLPVDEVAAEIAIALQADKLVYLLPTLPLDKNGTVIRQTTSVDARLDDAATRARDDGQLARIVEHARRASRAGVGRVHLLDQTNADALLAELYTRDGSGTLITAGRYDALRKASIQDVGGIIRLITPLQENGTLAPRSRERLELDIERFIVDTRDGVVVACAALFELDDADSVEIGCVATHPDYRGEGRADALMQQLEADARRRGRCRVLLLSTRTGHWFIERGYREASVDALPPSRRDDYNRSRQSKVYVKDLA